MHRSLLPSKICKNPGEIHGEGPSTGHAVRQNARDTLTLGRDSDDGSKSGDEVKIGLSAVKSRFPNTQGLSFDAARAPDRNIMLKMYMMGESELSVHQSIKISAESVGYMVSPTWLNSDSKSFSISFVFVL